MKNNKGVSMKMWLLTVLSFFFYSGITNAQEIESAQCKNVVYIYISFTKQHVAALDRQLGPKILSPKAFFSGMRNEFVKSWDPRKIFLLESDTQDLIPEMTDEATEKIANGDCEVYEKAAEKLEAAKKRSHAVAERILTQNDLKEQIQKRSAELLNNKQARTQLKEQYKKRASNEEELKSRHLNLLVSLYNTQKYNLSSLAEENELEQQAYAVAVKAFKRIISQNRKSNLAEDMLKAGFSGADAHSDYLTNEELNEMIQSMKAQFIGLGVGIVEGERGIYVQSLIAGGSAEQSKTLESKDLVVRINGLSTENMSLDEFRKNSMGTLDSVVELEIIRKGQLKKVSVIRKTVNQHAQNVIVNGYEVDGKVVGYVQLNSFAAENAATSMREHMDKLIKEKGKVDGWVLDLRNNPGGLYEMAADVAALFIGPNKIVSNELSIPKPGEKPFKTLKTKENSQEPYGEPLVVLISNNSASSSEILASALQLHGRGLIVGSEGTFKKGSMQTIMDWNRALPKGFKVLGGARLTSGYFFGLDGEPIQNRGVSPDVLIPLKNSDEEESDISESNLDHALPTPTSLAKLHPNQDEVKEMLKSIEDEREPLLEVARKNASKYGVEFVKSQKDKDVVLEAGKSVVVDIIKAVEESLKEQKEGEEKKI